jgi:hypothetical protein
MGLLCGSSRIEIKTTVKQMSHEQTNNKMFYLVFFPYCSTIQSTAGTSATRSSLRSAWTSYSRHVGPIKLLMKPIKTVICSNLELYTLELQQVSKHLQGPPAEVTRPPAMATLALCLAFVVAQTPCQHLLKFIK